MLNSLEAWGRPARGWSRRAACKRHTGEAAVAKRAIQQDRCRPNSRHLPSKAGPSKRSFIHLQFGQHEWRGLGQAV